MRKKTVFITVKDLQKRWSVQDPRTIHRIADRYNTILKPKKIAGKIQFHPDDVKIYEEHTRIIAT